MLKRFSAAKKLVKVGPQNVVIETPKGTSLPGTTCSDVLCVKIHLGVWGVALLKNSLQKNEEKTSHPKSTAKSRTETPEPIDTKFCMSSAVHDVITHANFWEDRLRGFGVAKGRILAFSIDLLRRL